MKKLLDDAATDELTRALLKAGAAHRPPPGSKAKLLVALGASSAVGLFSSKAFAWLWTTAGKVTLVGVAVGVSGALYLAAPAGPRDEAGTSGRASRGAGSMQAELDTPLPSGAGVSSLAGAPPVAVDDALTAPERAAPVASERSAPELVVSEPPLEPAPLDREQRAEKQRPPKAKRASKTARTKAGKPTPEPAPSTKEPVAEAAAGAAVVDAPAIGALAEGPATEAQQAEVAAAERSRLEAEVQLVDDMRRAARRQDYEALGHFVESYRQRFPDGQLRQEVADLARLERAAAR